MSSARSNAAAARNTAAAARALGLVGMEVRVREAVEAVGEGVEDLTETVNALEAALGLRLEAQTQVLAEIAETLRSPAHTRAAERVRHAAGLLRRGRPERALQFAEHAIDDDPNNPGGYLSAVWACLGLERPETAREYFREAASAAEEIDARSAAARRAVRLTFALEGAQPALAELPVENLDTGGLSREEYAAICYDRAVYLASAGDHPEHVCRWLGAAAARDGRFLQMALVDPILCSVDAVRKYAADELRAYRTLDFLIAEADSLNERKERLCSELNRYGHDAERRTVEAAYSSAFASTGEWDWELRHQQPAAGFNALAAQVRSSTARTQPGAPAA
jgi:tetratricopeptide (TPR) repeat protein